MDRSTADYMGMLATVMNALALQQALEKRGHSHPRAVGHRYERGGGTLYPPPGHPPPRKGPHCHFCCRHRPSLFHHRYDSRPARHRDRRRSPDESHQGGWRLPTDPEQDPTATKYDRITFTEVLQKNLKVMDATAISLARDQNMRIVVFNLRNKGNIKKVILGEPIGTVVEGIGHAE